MKLKIEITNLNIAGHSVEKFTIDQEMSPEELIAYAELCVGFIQKALSEAPSAEPEEPSAEPEAPSAEPEEPSALYHVLAGKYDGEEEYCKYSGSFITSEEARLAFDGVSDYPWARIERRGQVVYKQEPRTMY